jgi:two-component system alkaline phosphatase synthesis response regulator PhoP
VNVKKILIVDDEPDILEFLKYSLEMNGFAVFTALNGIDALLSLSNKPDLILLDIMMPQMDGYEVCRRIRENPDFKETPLIFLTARASEKDEIKGLELGASDFIAKPISTNKLIARVKSNLRRAEVLPSSRDERTVLEIGALKIDRIRYSVVLDGEEIAFPRKEFELLFFLAANPGKVHKRDEILKEVWGADVYVVDRTIDVHIRKIREKLGDFADYIETLKGVGYRFKESI